MDSPVSRAPPPKNSPAQGRSQVSLTPRQQHQLADLFASDHHIAHEVTWSVYQNIIDSYRAPNTRMGKALMQAEIACLSDAGVPRSLTEFITLGRTLKRQAGNILAYFDHPHTTGGPTEAINGRLEHLRGSALGFRNLTHYITRALLKTGRFEPQLHPQLQKPHLCTFAPTAGSPTICG